MLASTHERTDYSVEQVQSLLGMTLPNITGVTVVTHGYQVFDSDGDSMIDLARDIQTRAGGPTKSILLDYDVVDGRHGFDKRDSTLTLDSQAVSAYTSPTHLTLLWDWAADSHETSGSWWAAFAFPAAGDILSA